MEHSKQLANQRILVVGGAGFVGSTLVRLLLEASSSVHITVVDNLLSSEPTSIPADPRIDFIEGSIADNTVLSAIQDRYDYVFHLATYHGNQSSIHDPLADHANNTVTTLRLFEHLHGFKRLKKVVYSGAGCAVAEKTFGEAKASKEVDVVPLDADSPYSISKLVGEFYAKYYHKQHELPVVRARFQNVYGPGEILGAGRWRGTPATIWRNVVPTFVFKALAGQPLPLQNEGIATRDFIYVEDIARGLLACALNGSAGDVYNIATGKEISIATLSELINGMTENLGGIKHLPRRPWDHSGCRFGCPAKAKEELGFEVHVTIEEGLESTIAWMQDNWLMINRTIARHAPHLETRMWVTPELSSQVLASV